MDRLLPFVALGIGSAAALALGQGLERLTPETASLALGRVATVCGTVTIVECRASDRTVVLDFETPDDALRFSARIPPADRSRFGRRLENRFESRRACVTGPIEKYGAGYRIVLNRAEQLRVADEERAAAPPTLSEGIYRLCDEGVEPPRLIHEVKPLYPAEVMRARVQGRVVLQGIVGVDGLVRDIRIRRPLDGGRLDEEAIKALGQWRFEPGRFHGRSVPVVVTTEMAFHLH